MGILKTNVLYRRIAAELRAEMLCGQFAPGARLPTREQLIKRYGTTPVTVQKAFDLLAGQGWVRAAGRRGTFVKQPKTARREDYALAFPWPRHDRTSQFYRALRQQAEQLTNPQRWITSFYEIGRTDAEDYQRLAGLVRSHRLAGVIFASNPFEVEGLPVLEEPGVPRVLIASPQSQFPVPSVYPDWGAFYARAFDHLAQANRRRVAVITLANEGGGAQPPVTTMRLAAAHGLTIERRWIQATPSTQPHWARHAAEILFQPGVAHRPDALLITDDNLVPEATAGVRATGARVPADALVIAHTNFPYPTSAAVPVTRLGFDISRLLELCVERIDQQRRGETPPAATLLPAVFEDDVKQPVLAASASEEGVRA